MTSLESEPLEFVALVHVAWQLFRSYKGGECDSIRNGDFDAEFDSHW